MSEGAGNHGNEPDVRESSGSVGSKGWIKCPSPNPFKQLRSFVTSHRTKSNSWCEDDIPAAPDSSSVTRKKRPGGMKARPRPYSYPAVTDNTDEPAPDTELTDTVPSLNTDTDTSLGVNTDPSLRVNRLHSWPTSSISQCESTNHLSEAPSPAAHSGRRKRFTVTPAEPASYSLSESSGGDGLAAVSDYSMGNSTPCSNHEGRPSESGSCGPGEPMTAQEDKASNHSSDNNDNNTYEGAIFVDAAENLADCAVSDPKSMMRRVESDAPEPRIRKQVTIEDNPTLLGPLLPDIMPEPIGLSPTNLLLEAALKGSEEKRASFEVIKLQSVDCESRKVVFPDDTLGQDGKLSRLPSVGDKDKEDKAGKKKKVPTATLR